MGGFFKGLLVGMGVGLLVAPVKGEDMRRLARERYEVLRSSLPENEQLMQAGKQFASGVSQRASQLKDYSQQAASKVKDTGSNLAQQAASKAKDTGSNLGNLAQQATSKAKDTGSNLGNLAQQAASKAKQTGQETIKSGR
jgi:gas vesicle protein